MNLGCVAIIFAYGCLSIHFVSRKWLLWRKVTIGKCGSSSHYKSNFEWASVLCGSVDLLIIVFFLICKDDIVGQHMLLFLFHVSVTFLFSGCLRTFSCLNMIIINKIGSKTKENKKKHEEKGKESYISWGLLAFFCDTGWKITLRLGLASEWGSWRVVNHRFVYYND